MTDGTTAHALFTPLTIGTLTLPNRFAMAPMTRFASPGGMPGPGVAEYYARRAAGGTALIITEGIRIPHPAAGPDSVPELDGAEVLRGWQKVIDAVHAKGGAIMAQLWHEGSQHDVIDGDRGGQQSVSPSGLDLAGNPVGSALRTEELADLVHRRTDLYGGSIAARTRFPAEVVAAVRDDALDGFAGFDEETANATDPVRPVRRAGAGTVVVRHLRGRAVDPRRLG